MLEVFNRWHHNRRKICDSFFEKNIFYYVSLRTVPDNGYVLAIAKERDIYVEGPTTNQSVRRKLCGQNGFVRTSLQISVKMCVIICVFQVYEQRTYINLYILLLHTYYSVGLYRLSICHPLYARDTAERVSRIYMSSMPYIKFILISRFRSLMTTF